MEPILKGEIYIVNLDPTEGSEMKKSRPCVVVSNNSINKAAAIIIVCPITDAYGKNSPIHIPISNEGGLTKDSVVHCAQIRSIDKKRLRNKIGVLSISALENIDKGILKALGIF